MPVGGRRRIAICQTPPKPGRPISEPGDVCAHLRGAELADRESMYAVHLDAQNRVVGVEEVARGTLTATETSARELFKGAILNNANAIIVAHNHPSGSSTPSDADYAVTGYMAKAGKLLGIPVLDHVIVSAGGGCRSLRGMRADLFMGAHGAPRRRSRTRR